MLTVHLLGPPRVSVGGDVAPAPRGRKVWAILAYLVASEGPVERSRLAELLFSEADDPMGALRWSLAELRRLLGPSVQIGGAGVVTVRLPLDVWVDVEVLRRATWVEAVEIPGLGSELLAGLTFPRSHGFESWLLNERRHMQAASAGVLREAALARMGEGRASDAIDLAARLVALDPFEEISQELLIRAYATSGDRAAASRQLEAYRGLIREELGVEPSTSLAAAVDALPLASRQPVAVGTGAARAQLETGMAAVAAGALDAGLEALRRSVAAAHAAGDVETKVRASIALGNALVHAARGRDEEGSAVLHEALVGARAIGRPDLELQAHLPLAWADVLRGRLERAEVRMREAKALITGSAPELADVLGTIADARMHRGRLDDADRLFREAIQVAVAHGDDRREALWRAERAACCWLVGDPVEAKALAERSIELCRSLSWTALQPFPEVIAGLVELGRGNTEAANELLEHAFAMGCQVGDCCWEGLAQMGLGLVADARNDVPLALERLQDARTRGVREPDADLFAHALTLDALIDVALRRGAGEPERWIVDLGSLAARAGFGRLLERAREHREQLDRRATSSPVV